MEDSSKENTASQQTISLKGLGFKRPQFKAPGFAQPAKKSATVSSSAKPLGPPAATFSKPTATTAPVPSSTTSSDLGASSHYFSVLYTKYQPSKKLRKNKNFADGILEIKPGNKATLYEPEGKVVSTTTLSGYNAATLGNGSQIIMGNWELEVDDVMDEEKFKSGTAFLKPQASAPVAASGGLGKFKLPTLAAGAGRSGAFKRPVAAGASAAAARPTPKPLHDPHAPGAVILNENQWKNGSGRDSSGNFTVPVVLDPFLGRHMRPHQIEGLKFLYECTTGVRQQGQMGAILADAMGLGKTLTTLSLLWTLLRQGPAGKPTVSKALVVTPSSLTKNWAAEARKWLGDERLRTMVIPPGAEGNCQALAFKHGSVAKVGIISYETLRQHASTLAGSVGVLVADEGHRLKSAQGNKTISALLSLNCPRRVILSGTPVQNNLSEFFAMADFVCPDALGSLASFNRVFAGPISRSRDRNASQEDRDLGEARSAELANRVESFVLRRGAEINSRYLPPLSLYVVFCKPSAAQMNLLGQVLGSSRVRRLLSATGADFGDQALSVLTNLRKICNHPALYQASTTDNTSDDANNNSTEPAAGTEDPSLSGKMAALVCLLNTIVNEQRSRCVVVSQSTAMLDLVSNLCRTSGYSTVRIDGSTDVNKRQDIVDAFNRHGVGQVFLLSTTAGGAGLNLTGASRLVLCDSHWNPALDQQAMARVWRDGQRSACVIYRLITTGTLEEKIYQRQRAKGDIAAITVGVEAASGAGKGGGKSGGGQFSKEELKQLFSVRTDTCCDTADVLGVDQFADASKECEDAPLVAAVGSGHVTYVHLESTQGGGEGGGAVAAGGEAKEVEEGDGGVLEEEEAIEDDESELEEELKADAAAEGDDGGNSASQLEVDDDEWMI